MEHITILTSITASGISFKPFIIFQRKTCPEVLINSISEGHCHIGGQESGWIFEKSLLDWSKEFIKEVNSYRESHGIKDKTMYFFTDGHNSRENVEFIKTMKDANIVLITFPAHCSHILQALDVLFFKIFKGKFKKNWALYLNENIKMFIQDVEKNIKKEISEADIKRYKMVNLIVDMLKVTATIRRIKLAFKYSGLCPWDVTMPLSNYRIRVRSDIRRN